MCEEATIACEQHNLPEHNPGYVFTINREHVARPHGGYHARPCDSQSALAIRTKHFGKEFAFDSMLVASFVGRGHEAHQEFFRLVLHCNCPGLTLPHDRAILSKTRS